MRWIGRGPLRTQSRWALAAAIAGVTGVAVVAAFAASMTLRSGSLSVFKPGDLPPVPSPSASPSQSPSPPPPACTAGTATVTAIADAYVAEQSPNVNNGAAVDLFVRSRSGANNRTLVRFNLPTIPSGCTLASATLRLYNSAPTTGRTIQAFQVNAPWSETGVTWANQPATTGTAATSVTTASAGWQTWTVTTLVQAMYAGANNGFLLRDASEGSSAARSQTYRAREAGVITAELVVTWS